MSITFTHYFHTKVSTVDDISASVNKMVDATIQVKERFMGLKCMMEVGAPKV